MGLLFLDEPETFFWPGRSMSGYTSNESLQCSSGHATILELTSRDMDAEMYLAGVRCMNGQGLQPVTSHQGHACSARTDVQLAALK